MEPAQNGVAALVPPTEVTSFRTATAKPLSGSAEAETSGVCRFPFDCALSTPGAFCQGGRAATGLNPPPPPPFDRGSSQPASSRYDPSVAVDRSVPPTEIAYWLSDGNETVSR